MHALRQETHRSRSRAGFTLIEILIVVTIVGVLLATAIPSVGRSVSRDRVQRSAMVAHGMLEEATRLASRRGTPVTVTISGGQLRVADRNSGTVLKQRSFGQGQDLRADLAIQPTTGIVIFPNGRGSEALVLTLTGAGETQTVTRTTTGILRRQ